MLELLLDHLNVLVGYAGTAILVLKGDELVFAGIRCHGEERLAPEQEQELFRLAQEALNNVLNHAHARTVRVRLDLTGDQVVVEVADDGVGFEPSWPEAGGYGLPGMRERAERLGGTLQVESTPGAGTRVRVEVPR